MERCCLRRALRTAGEAPDEEAFSTAVAGRVLRFNAIKHRKQRTGYICSYYEQENTEPLHVTIDIFTVMKLAGCHHMTSNHNTGGRKLAFIYACGLLTAL